MALELCEQADDDYDPEHSPQRIATSKTKEANNDAKEPLEGTIAGTMIHGLENSSPSATPYFRTRGGITCKMILGWTKELQHLGKHSMCTARKEVNNTSESYMDQGARLSLGGDHASRRPSQQPEGPHNCQEGIQKQQLGRNEEFDLDLEEIMVMEAIWLFIWEHGLQRISVSTPSSFENILASGHRCHRLDQEVQSEATMSITNLGDLRELIPRSYVTWGIDSAIATLAEHNAFYIDVSVADQSAKNYQAIFNLMKIEQKRPIAQQICKIYLLPILMKDDVEPQQ
eukprot:Gb_15207 [translate_table: standard]